MVSLAALKVNFIRSTANHSAAIVLNAAQVQKQWFSTTAVTQLHT
jgi:hypothetical protein